jgi:Domain of unknown function DUF29
MSDLYHAGFALWSAQQAEALRSAAREHSNAPLDWENLAEEIEGLGASERRALTSHVRAMIEHLMKLRLSLAAGPRSSWKRTIRRAWADIETIPETNLSLRRELCAIVGRETIRARPLVADDMAEHGGSSIDLDALTFDVGQVTGPWLP